MNAQCHDDLCSGLLAVSSDEAVSIFQVGKQRKRIIGLPSILSVVLHQGHLAALVLVTLSCGGDASLIARYDQLEPLALGAEVRLGTERVGVVEEARQHRAKLTLETPVDLRHDACASVVGGALVLEPGSAAEPFPRQHPIPPCRHEIEAIDDAINDVLRQLGMAAEHLDERNIGGAGLRQVGMQLEREAREFGLEVESVDEEPEQ